MIDKNILSSDFRANAVDGIETGIELVVGVTFNSQGVVVQCH